VAERLAADEERTRQESVRLSAAWARAMGTGWVPAVAEREHERLVAEVASYADAVAGFADACAAGDAATARHLGEALDALGERVHAAASALRDTLGVTGRWPLAVEGRQRRE
jgi:ApbE superfamily uncharacterized protein (UPF0280 family)